MAVVPLPVALPAAPQPPLAPPAGQTVFILLCYFKILLAHEVSTKFNTAVVDMPRRRVRRARRRARADRVLGAAAFILFFYQGDLIRILT